MTHDEFLALLDTSSGPMACHAWTGTVSASTGYGTIGGGDRKRYAHRLAYEFARGPIAPGMVVRHLCVDRSTRRIAGGPMAERACCNARHLEVGTKRENAADRSRAGRNGRVRPQGRRYW